MRASAKFALAGVIGAVAAGAWVMRPRSIDRPEADAVAGRVLAAYVREAGDFSGHFSGAGAVRYDDGWDYRWVYVPCPDVAELRVFVTRRGAASITATPDCEARSAMESPRTV